MRSARRTRRLRCLFACQTFLAHTFHRRLVPVCLHCRSHPFSSAEQQASSRQRLLVQSQDAERPCLTAPCPDLSVLAWLLSRIRRGVVKQAWAIQWLLLRVLSTSRPRQPRRLQRQGHSPTSRSALLPPEPCVQPPRSLGHRPLGLPS
jgi:hypothetical protein